MASAQLLVVDDEPTILATLKRTLELEGHKVEVAGGVRLAEEKLSKRTFDAILLDVALPDGDGLTLLERLRAAKQDTPVIMMSGHATIDAAVRATRLGALDFLEKPLSTDRLLVVIDNLLRLVRAEREAQELRKAVGYCDELIGDSRCMVELRDRIARAARAQASVLITGERGTGKELVARAIHRSSPRSRQPLEKMNCAAVPAELLESELFGHEAGAFTGATRQRRGRFERAHGGTLFLDEVGDMPVAMQAKLLRVLQEREIERVGGHETIRLDVRVVAATNKDLRRACETGEFRADLLDRLDVVPMEVPALRRRSEDVPQLAAHFLALAQVANGRPRIHFAPGAIDGLQHHPFPGNVRELRNLVERLVILTPGDQIGRSEVEAALFTPSPQVRGLYRPGVAFRELVEDAERRILDEALRAHDGQMAATARALDLERSHLYKKARSLGLRAAKEEE